MKLNPLKCKQCGANIYLDNSKNSTVCSHCGTEFVLNGVSGNGNSKINISSNNTYSNRDKSNINISNFQEKDLQQTICELEERFSPPRRVNEHLLKKKVDKSEKKKWYKILLTVFLNIILAIIIAFASFIVADTISSTVQGVSSAFFGFSNMQVVSSSMVRSGFNVGGTLICRTVNPRTLHGGKYMEGSIIAFYRDSSVESKFNLESSTLLTDYADSVQYDMSFSAILNIRNTVMQQAGRKKCEIVFHHIKDVYVDSNGQYWFKTYGSSNADPWLPDETIETHVPKEKGTEITMGIDSWYVNENLVVGVYDDSPAAKTMSFIVLIMSSGGGLMLLLIPIAIIAFIFIRKFLKDIQLIKLEADVVEDRRKVTDDICVVNDIGKFMDEDSKLITLCRAEEDKWNAYVSLLWQVKDRPTYIADYATTRRVLLPVRIKEMWLYRTCQQRLGRGDDKKQVALFFLTEKSKLDIEQKKIDNAIKQLPKTFTLSELESKLKSID